MHIGVDVRCFAGGKTTGVEEYTRHFLETLFARDTQNEYVLFFNAYKGMDVDFSWATAHTNVTLKTFHIPNKILNAALWYLRMPKIDRLLGGVDVFFMPNINFVALSRGCKCITTVHDVSFALHKETFSWKRRMWHWLVNPRKLMTHADHVLAVSQATRDTIRAVYGIPGDRISVAYNGKTDVHGTLTRNDAQVLAVKNKYHLPYKFILSFGTLEPRKNIGGVIRAFTRFRASGNGDGYKLVIAGARGWHDAEIEAEIGTSMYKEDIIRIENVPEEDKEALYVLADLFVYPSFFEGFGFPPLEALMSGTPVITSHNSSLPEVVGENAVLVDPARTEELAIALHEVLSQKNLRDHIADSTEIYKHAQQFSWHRAVDVFLRILTKD